MLNNTAIKDPLLNVLSRNNILVKIKEKQKNDKLLNLIEVNYLKQMQKNYSGHKLISNYLKQYNPVLNSFYKKYNKPSYLIEVAAQHPNSINKNVYDPQFNYNRNLDYNDNIVRQFMNKLSKFKLNKLNSNKNALSVKNSSFGDIVQLFAEEYYFVNPSNKLENIPYIPEYTHYFGYITVLLWPEKYSKYVTNVEEKLKNILDILSDVKMPYIFVNPNDVMIKREFGGYFPSNFRFFIYFNKSRRNGDIFILFNKYEIALRLKYNDGKFSLEKKTNVNAILKKITELKNDKTFKPEFYNLWKKLGIMN